MGKPIARKGAQMIGLTIAKRYAKPFGNRLEDGNYEALARFE